MCCSSDTLRGVKLLIHEPFYSVQNKESEFNFLMADRAFNHAPERGRPMKDASPTSRSMRCVLPILCNHSLLFLLVIQILCHKVVSSCTTDTTTTGFKSKPVIVVIAYDRSSQLRHTLRSIAEASPPNVSIPTYVSVDDNPKAYRYVNAV